MSLATALSIDPPSSMLRPSSFISLPALAVLGCFAHSGQVRAADASDVMRSPEPLAHLVKGPPGFRVSVFATSDQVSHPVALAASPEGMLFVAGDTGSSRETAGDQARIVRLRDTDEDGRADEVRTFARVDCPRALLWDRDRLYVVHPPHLSVFRDLDGDGVADGQQILVRNLAPSPDDRPADAATYGAALGVDGWLYLALGDDGVTEAEGTDGRRLALSGGNLVRVRPDGSGLELFSHGTHRVSEIALSPRLDGMVVSTTIEGGERHGGLRHLAAHAAQTVGLSPDRNLGPGRGALWLDEPGIPAEWNRAPFTVDEDGGAIHRHRLATTGATFTATPEVFLELPRPTDLDADALSSLYVASRYGAPPLASHGEAGFIVRLDPLDFHPEPMPNFAELSNRQLVERFHAPSQRLRLAAQRALLRRDPANVIPMLENMAGDATNALETRILTLFTLKLARGAAAHAFLAGLAGDPDVEAWAIRALVDHEGQLASVPARTLLLGLESRDARVRLEAAMALARLGQAEHAAAVDRLRDDPDPVVAQAANTALERLRPGGR